MFQLIYAAVASICSFVMTLVEIIFFTLILIVFIAGFRTQTDFEVGGIQSRTNHRDDLQAVPNEQHNVGAIGKTQESTSEQSPHLPNTSIHGEQKPAKAIPKTHKLIWEEISHPQNPFWVDTKEKHAEVLLKSQGHQLDRCRANLLSIALNAKDFYKVDDREVLEKYFGNIFRLRWVSPILMLAGNVTASMIATNLKLTHKFLLIPQEGSFMCFCCGTDFLDPDDYVVADCGVQFCGGCLIWGEEFIRTEGLPKLF